MSAECSGHARTRMFLASRNCVQRHEGMAQQESGVLHGISLKNAINKMHVVRNIHPLHRGRTDGPSEMSPCQTLCLNTLSRSLSGCFVPLCVGDAEEVPNGSLVQKRHTFTSAAGFILDGFHFRNSLKTVFHLNMNMIHHDLWRSGFQILS